MASSSSSGVMASSSAAPEPCIYDVFLSFRGEDTRHSFTDHLYHRLKRAGIHTFRDDEEVNRGEELKPGFERAIKASKASIVVLSENYATSAWCLDELLLILQQRRECNHIVVPVFYHVEPTNVRNQIGSFAIEVKPSSRWTYENVYLWKRALMEVANLSGFTLSGHESSVLKKIVDTMYNKLGPRDVHLPLNITGMATRYEEINSWLYQSNLEFLAIYGMGGSGKTTFAKYIYDSNQKSFEYVSFIENIGSRSKKTNDLLKLQEQLIKDILGGKKRKISGVSQGTCMIEEALQTKRVLIVLDDIVQQSQLDTLLGTGKINSQSKIIITTRERFDMSCWRCQQYEMKLLNADESLELLCRHAFRSKIPMVGFEEAVLQATKYCEGNPLALEVLGSSMSNNTTINYWKSQLNLLDKDIHSGIQSVLIRSYMALPYNTQKELFLHIACFFIGKDVDYVVQILEPDYSAISGIQTLISRCLLSVSPNKKLMMHRLLQEMGKNIVRQESTRFPAERSRVWHSNDSYKILSKENGSEKIEGLALDMKMLSEENFALKVRGWRKTGRPKQVNSSFTELKMIRCIIHGPEYDDIYNIAEMVKSSIGDKTIAFTSSLLEGEMKSGRGTNLTDGKIAETVPLLSPQKIYDKQEIKSDDETDSDSISIFDDMTIQESDLYLREQEEGEGTSKAFAYDDIKSNSPVHDQEIKKIVFTVNLSSRIKRHRMRKALSRVQGIKLIDYDKNERKLTVTGDVDYMTLGARIRKIAHADLLSVGPASERLAKEHGKPGYNSGEEDKPGYESDGRITNSAIGEGENLSSATSAHPCRLFSFAEIKSATKSFNGKLVLRKGGTGTTYKGQISSKEAGHVVAIKRYGTYGRHKKCRNLVIEDVNVERSPYGILQLRFNIFNVEG
ncbi:hypothetical protein M8C21_019016 [Ambrosia artemisiifolia]|uniref:TIR domain-containing protein n=1 Tax=Ambrosia artemisiifolia TaxID=4212 RepID=A0AAD5BSZ9_AMBAR|nr:hypothetical protein M8C21_019016 [Ambrosia artemisiifolia]